MSFTILYSIEDEKGKRSTTEVKVPTATDYADVKIFAQQMAPLIDALVTGAIVRIGISDTVVLPAGLAASPAANSDVEEGGRFQWRTNGGYYTGLRLPTFDEALVNAGSRDINLTDGDVSAFLTAMTDGIDLTGAGGSGTIYPCDYRDDDIVALEFAREQFQSSRG